VMIAERYRSDTVAALACSEMSDPRLRGLVWRLKKSDTGTHLCVAPTLLDVAGAADEIQPSREAPMLHMDHSELSGLPRMIKSATDRVVSAVALLLASHNRRITGLTCELAGVTLKLQLNPWLVSASMARPRSLTPEEVELPVFLGNPRLCRRTGSTSKRPWRKP
jgi:hypothetical protein